MTKLGTLINNITNGNLVIDKIHDLGSKLSKKKNLLFSSHVNSAEKQLAAMSDFVVQISKYMCK